MPRTKTTYPTARSKTNGNATANLGFEQKLWLTFDALCEFIRAKVRMSQQTPREREAHSLR
jgi:hypothetical protein